MPTAADQHPRRRAVRRTAAAGAVAAAALLAGCPPGDRPPIAGTDTPEVGIDRVAAVEVHPLSRVRCPGEGGCELLLHVAVTDEAGRAVRSPGRLRVTVRPPAGETQDAGGSAWDVDLADPDGGAARYDAVITHTYALRLAGLPGWLEAWAHGGSAASTGPGPTVRVELALGGRTLRAERALVR